MSRRQRRRRAKLLRHATARGKFEREREGFVVQRFEDADAHWRRLLPTRAQLAHAPQFVTVGVVTGGLAAHALAPAPCDLPPCANAAGGGAAVLLGPEFGIDAVPTRGSHVRVEPVPMMASGTVGPYRTVWTWRG